MSDGATLQPPDGAHDRNGGAGLRAITRLAVRSVRRERRRSMLIVALLALPVAVAVVVAAGQRAVILTPEEQQAHYFGQADVVLEGDLSALTGLFVDGEAAPGTTSTARDLGVDLATIQDLATTASTLTDADVTAAVEAETAGAPVARFVRGYEIGIGRDYVVVMGLDATNPLSEGIVTIDSGRAPGDGEAALAPAAAAMLDAEVGDTIELPGLGSAVVSGLFRQNSYADANAVLVSPEMIPDPGWTTWLIGTSNGAVPADASILATRVTERLFGSENVDVARSFGALYSQMPADTFGYDPGAVLQLDRPPVLAGFVTAGLLLIVALIAAAAFATGARRRVREFGLMATIGADPGHIRRLVLVEAVLLGGIGVALGIAIGFVGAEASTPLMEHLAQHVVDDVGASAADVVAPTFVGIAGALGAAWFPARSISRVPVLAALNGRVPQRALRARVVPLAVVLLSIGLVLIGAAAASLSTTAGTGDAQVVAMITGCVLCLAAAALGATWVSGLVARHAERLPLGARLVARDAGRQRFRTAVSVAGLVVVLAAPVMVMSAVITAENEGRSTYQSATRPDEVVLGFSPRTAAHDGSTTAASPTIGPGVVAEAEAAIDAVVPVKAAGSVSGLVRSVPPSESIWGPEGAVWANVLPSNALDVFESVSFDSGWVGLGTPDAVAALRLPTEAAELLAAGTAVTTAESSGIAQIQWCDDTAEDAGRTPPADPCESRDIVVTAFAGRDRTWTEPAVLLPPSVATDFGLVPVADAELVVFVADGPLTTAQREAIGDLVLVDYGTGGATFGDISEADIRVSTHDAFEPFAARVAAIALPATLAVVLVLGGCLVAIAATESDRDIATMVRVGAAPGLRRRFGGLQGWYHAALGAALGAPVGLLVLVALRNAIRDPYPLSLPWGTLGAVVVAMPIALGLAVMAVTRAAPPRPVSGR